MSEMDDDQLIRMGLKHKLFRDNYPNVRLRELEAENAKLREALRLATEGLKQIQTDAEQYRQSPHCPELGRNNADWFDAVATDFLYEVAALLGGGE